MGQLSLGLALSLLFGAAQADLPPDWKIVVSKAGGFVVAMPKNPTESKKKVATATGHLEVFLLVALGENDATMVVSYCDYAEEELKGNLEKRLDHARDGAVNGARGKLQSEKRAQLIDGEVLYPGRDIVIEKGGAVVARMRIFLVGRRLYQVMALGNTSPRQAGAFMDSFRLNK